MRVFYSMLFSLALLGQSHMSFAHTPSNCAGEFDGVTAVAFTIDYVEDIARLHQQIFGISYKQAVEEYRHYIDGGNIRSRILMHNQEIVAVFAVHVLEPSIMSLEHVLIAPSHGPARRAIVKTIETELQRMNTRVVLGFIPKHDIGMFLELMELGFWEHVPSRVSGAEESAYVKRFPTVRFNAENN